MNEATEIFQKHGYVVIKSVVPTILLNFITQYALFDELQDFTLDLGQVLGAHAKYLDPAMESLLLMLHEPMEKSTGLTLYPTYSYFRVYRNGQELTPHIDRQSCEISSTLCFNYSYDSSTYEWPIYMDGNKVILKPGDMAVYKGCDLTHWREKFLPPNNKEEWHVQGFFHYVDANGPFKDFKFDKRSQIGAPRKVPKLLNLNKPYLMVDENIYLGRRIS